MTINITYLKQKYQIIDILKNQDINEKIDINKIYSDDKFIDKEICQFMINKENKQ